jgi:hypothetical protein
MAKKQPITENVEATISVKIIKACVFAEDTTQRLDAFTAQHLINMGYAKEISSGESGQTNNDTPTHENEG